MAVAFGAVLITAGCATAITQVADTQVDQGSRYDGSVEQLLLYCGKLSDAGELPTAASICERAYNIDPTDPRPLLKLGEIFTAMERLPQAASAYLTVLEQTPHNVEARYLLGKTYIAMGRHDLALQELQFALTVSPEDARVYNALGIANGMLGNTAAAQQAFKDGLKVAPDDVSLRNNLGLALVLDGLHDEGIAMLKDVALDPAANATTIRNLQLAESIAQSASANQAIADANTTESASTPGESQLASAATAPSDFSNAYDAVMPEVLAETPEATAAPSQPPAVVREPVLLTEALPAPVLTPAPAPALVGDVQLADTGMPVYLASNPSDGEPESFAAPVDYDSAAPLAEEAESSETVLAESQKDSRDTSASTSVEELSLASMPQPVLEPEYKQSSSAIPAATGEMQDIVTANAEPIKPPMTLTSSPRETQTAALVDTNIYSVQLASYRSADRAQDGWQQIRASALDLLQDVEPVIQRSDLGPEKGIYFRLRTERSSKESANQLCSALQARGLSCLTIREDSAAPANPTAPANPAATGEATKPAAAKS